jgi:hypothetical protein
MSLLRDADGSYTAVAQTAVAMLALLSAAGVLFGLFLVGVRSCAELDAAAARSPQNQTSPWVLECAKHRPLLHCERDLKTLERRAAR